MTLLCKIIIAAKFREMKTGCNLVPSKEDYGSKMAVLSVMMMMMITVNLVRTPK
jgi:hypothetical protein